MQKFIQQRITIYIFLFIQLFFKIIDSSEILIDFKVEGIDTDPSIWSNQNNLNCQAQISFEYIFDASQKQYTAVGCGSNLLIIETFTGVIIRQWSQFTNQIDLNTYQQLNIKYLEFYSNILVVFTDNLILKISQIELLPNIVSQYIINEQVNTTFIQQPISTNDHTISQTTHLKNSGSKTNKILYTMVKLNEGKTLQLDIDLFQIHEINLLSHKQQKQIQLENEQFIAGIYNQQIHIWDISDLDGLYNLQNNISINIDSTENLLDITNILQRNKILAYTSQNNLILYEYPSSLQSSNSNTISIVNVGTFKLSLITSLHFTSGYQISIGTLDGIVYVYDISDLVNMQEKEKNLLEKGKILNLNKLPNINYLTAVSEQASMIIIKICPYFCQNCNETSCTQCKDNRDSLPFCTCESGLIEDQTYLQCTRTDCKSNCSTCVLNKNKCEICSEIGKMVPSCNNDCIDGYYSTGSAPSQSCTKCDESCMTCQDTSIKCISCLPSYTYDSGSNTCTLNCSSKCNGCSSIYDNCTLCADSNKIAPSCNQCTSQKYNDTNNVCQNCDSQCQECFENSNQCTVCTDSLMVIPDCNQCKPGYYKDGSNNCQICNSPCQQCIDNPNKCTQCIENYTLVLATNTCNSLVCQSQCNNCIDQADNCLQCTEILRQKPNCTDCIIGYFENSGTNLCEKCDKQCSECINLSNNCQKCSNLRNNNPPYCTCLSSFYEDVNSDCQKCDIKCLECQNQSNECTQCNINRNNNPPYCTCLQSFYEAQDGQCYQCNKKCLECDTNSNKCSLCSNKRSDPPNCNCISQYYQDDNGECQKCDNSCLECINISFECTKCAKGYYLDQKQCKKCDGKCEECEFYSGNCTVCSQNSIDDKPTCTCKSGYFLNIETQNCDNCSHPCGECSNSSTNCTTCIPDHAFNDNQVCIQICSGSVIDDCISKEVITPNNNQSTDEVKDIDTEDEQEPASEAAVVATEKMKQASTVVVSSFVLLAIFGYFYMLVSIIDFTQLLYMLMYINVKYNQNLLLFYKALQSFAIPYIPHFFKHWAYNEKETRAVDPAPETFTKHGYYSFFLENVGFSYTVLLIPVGILLFFKFLAFILKPFNIKLIKFIRSKVQKICINMKYSTFIELIFMEFINLTAACFMQYFYLPKLSTNLTGILTYIFWILTCLFIIFYPIYFHLQTIKYLRQRNEQFRQNFGHFWDGLQIEKGTSISFMYILHYRKSVYALIIVVFYQFQTLQLISLIIVHLSLIAYMVYFKPFSDIYSYYINIITELIFVLVLVLTLGSCNVDNCTNDGWIIIFGALFVLFMHITYIVITIAIQKIQKLKSCLQKKQQRIPGERRKGLTNIVVEKELTIANQNSQPDIQQNQEQLDIEKKCASDPELKSSFQDSDSNSEVWDQIQVNEIQEKNKQKLQNYPQFSISRLQSTEVSNNDLASLRDSNNTLNQKQQSFRQQRQSYKKIKSNRTNKFSIGTNNSESIDSLYNINNQQQTQQTLKTRNSNELQVINENSKFQFSGQQSTPNSGDGLKLNTQRQNLIESVFNSQNSSTIHSPSNQLSKNTEQIFIKNSDFDNNKFYRKSQQLRKSKKFQSNNKFRNSTAN